MLKHFSSWKHVIFGLVILLGFLYALPNFYGENPIVKVTGTWIDIINENVLNQIKEQLKKEKISAKSITLKNKEIIIILSSTDNQIRVSQALIKKLNEKYLVSLGFLSKIPSWLMKIHASPMKLGLDLRGGVHLVIDMDLNTVTQKLQEQYMLTLYDDLENKNISYKALHKETDHSIRITFYDKKFCDQAANYLRKMYNDLFFFKENEKKLLVTITSDRLKMEQEYAIQHDINVLRNRLNQLGIFESIVHRQGFNQIIIELPGIQSAEREKKFLGRTTMLEFRLVNTDLNNFNVKNKHFSYDSEIKKTRDGQLVPLYKRAILSGDYIIDSNSSLDEYNRPQVNIFLNKAGGNILSQFTKKNIGKFIATIFVEYKETNITDPKGHSVFLKTEEIINIANIQSHLEQNFRITGIKNQNEARQLSLLFRSGSLITPIRIIEERITGPTLGKQHIKQGLNACLLSVLMPVAIMILFYKKFGMISSIMLIINLVLIIDTISLLPGAVLTMPGIAGIILTLAVAIDANVIINERIKEEINKGCSIQKAINKGYKRASSAIFDANITTLIKIIILYKFGTGAIQSFAISAGIGVVTSMFTAVFGTRIIVNFLYGRDKLKSLFILRY